MHAAEDDHREHEANHARNDVGPPPFGLLDDIMREGAHPTWPLGTKIKK